MTIIYFTNPENYSINLYKLMAKQISVKQRKYFYIVAHCKYIFISFAISNRIFGVWCFCGKKT